MEYGKCQLKLGPDHMSVDVLLMVGEFDAPSPNTLVLTYFYINI